jgi:protein-tyrosine phosphatase
LAGTHPWPDAPTAKRAALWLIFLGPFFYASYGLANYLASLRASVPDIAMRWEKDIPFMAWTIIPYWSVNLFYAATLFFSPGPDGVDRTARRYLTCQLIAVACFILFPLRAIFEKPETSGLSGFMFDALGSFDKPFNQAPSLHIALLTIVWDHWRGRLPGGWKYPWNVWCALIGLSVLTTFQHHVMDIPTGFLLGLSALWLVPERGAGFGRGAGHSGRTKLAMLYGMGALAFLALAALTLRFSPLSLFWLWPALSLALVSAAYFRLGAAAFQKHPDGSVTRASFWLFMPYRWGARVNAWAWTRKLPAHVHIAGNVWLGQFPNESEIKGFHAVIDMTGEMPAPKHEGVIWQSFPVLDLTQPSKRTLSKAAQAIQAAQENGKTLVACALGMQRSAAAAGQWLLASGRAKNAAEAISILRKSGRPIHLDAALLEGETRSS